MLSLVGKRRPFSAGTGGRKERSSVVAFELQESGKGPLRRTISAKGENISNNKGRSRNIYFIKGHAYERRPFPLSAELESILMKGLARIILQEWDQVPAKT